MPSMAEVLWDQLSLLSPNGQPLLVSFPAQGKQVMPVSSWPVRSVCAENDLQLVTYLVHQHVVRVLSA